MALTVLLTAVLPLLATGCSRPDVKERAQERLRAHVGLARQTVARELASGAQDRDRLQAALFDALGTTVLVTAVTTDRGLPSVDAVVTVGIEDGGGLSYSAWTSRACVVFTASPSDRGTVTTRDATCPSTLTPDLESADEVLLVAG